MICLLGLVLYLYFQHSTHEVNLEQQIYTNENKVSDNPIYDGSKVISQAGEKTDGAETVTDDDVSTQGDNTVNT